MCEDNDIRIAGSHPSREISSSADLDAEASLRELSREKENGNLEKARGLGAAAAAEVYADNGESFFGMDSSENAQMREQRQMLLAFAAVVGFDKYDPNAHCARAALSTFYETLKRDAPQIYDDVERSFAFSFYFLEYHRGRDVAAAIGQTFAMLCGRPGDSVCAQLGKALYLRFLDVIQSMAEHTGFVKEEPAGKEESR